uniref:Late embryogenesis abundant protein LEA-2 subgroup domain-containing protein n=1 Tax=Ananas comosus var. bracteatus TaxID=296719 RepID=A0A6V7Q0V4_ANACO|nr:unnamed protein product [Ananas comosus var. bracteatus]
MLQQILRPPFLRRLPCFRFLAHIPPASHRRQRRFRLPHRIRPLPSGALLFNLTADLSLRNPNSRIGVYYDRLDAAAFYSGALLGPADSPFPEFYQHPKTTTAVSAVFEGRAVDVGAGVSEAFGREKGEGRSVWKSRYKVWFAKVHGFKPKVDCVVKLLPPPPTAASSAAAFAPTKCSVDY